MMLHVDLSNMAFIMLRCIPFIMLRCDVCPLSGELFFFFFFVIMGVELYVKIFVCNYWNNHMIFILQFLNMELILHAVNTDWFADTEKSFHPCDKCHLIMVYDIFVQFSLLVLHWGYLHLCLSMLLACDFVFCYIFVWIWYPGDSGFIEQVWEYSFLWNFLDDFQKDRGEIFYKWLIEFSC